VPPKPFTDGSFRKVEVKVKISAPVVMHYRPGYYPPKL
jgi:hypothetical protein